MHMRQHQKVVLLFMAGLLAACGSRPLNTPTPLGPVAAASMPVAAPTPKPTATPAAKKTTTTDKATTSAKASPKPATSTSAKPATTTQTGTTASTKSAEDQVAELLAGVQDLAEKTQNFVATVQSLNVDPATNEPQKVTARYAWAKPNMTAIDIQQSTQSAAVGAKVLWTGGQTAKIRAKVLGLPVKVELAITDKNLINKRGYTFADTSIDCWQRNILDPTAKITIRGKQTMPNGKMGIVFDCISSHMMPGVTKETYALEMESKAPLLCQHYVGTTCVYEVQVKEVQFNVSLPADTFTL